MKKFFSLVLALVMALSLTTVAWGASDALQDAIAAGQTDITLTAGNYTMPQDHAIQGKTVTISGPKAAVIDISAIPTNGSQAFTNTTLVFDGVTINCATQNYKGFTHAASLTYKNCQINGLQFLYAPTVVFENCKLNSNGAEHCVWTYGAQNVTFTGCEFTYGDRGINVYSDNDIPGGKQTVNFEDCTFTATNPASDGAVEINSSKFSAGADVELTDCIAPAYGEMSYVSSWDSTGGAKTDIVVDGALVGGVAEVGGTQYKSLTEAMNAVTSGATIVLLDDITITQDWDCRNNGAKFRVPVTIDGDGHKLTFTGKIDDRNWNTVFRFEDTATVKNLTIDVSAATGVQRGITSKGSIVVENFTFIGNGTSARYGVIFGEGAGSAISNVTATVTGSTFENTSYGVSDNRNGQDAKSVTVTDSTFTNAAVLLSASESVTFNDNTVEGKGVSITSYSSTNELAVTATGNTLDADEDNQIVAATITAQGGFLTPVGEVGGKYYTSLQDVVDKTAAGGTVTLLRDCDDDVTVGKALTFDFNGYTYSGVITPAPGYSYMDGVVKKTPAASGTTSTGTVTTGTVTPVKAKLYRLAAVGGSMIDTNTKVEKIELTTVTGKLVNDVPVYVPDIYKINSTYYVEVAKAHATYALKNNGVYTYLAPAGTASNVDAVIAKFATAVVLDQYVAAAEDVECGDAVKGTKGAAIYKSGTDAYYANGSNWAYFNGEFVKYDKNTKVAYKEHKWDATSIIVKSTDVKGTKVPVTIECKDCEKTFSIVPTAKFDNTWVKGVNYTTDKAVDKYNTAAVKYYIVLNDATYTGGTYVPSVPSTDKVVQSADTFDAGIVMYVGMSVMAAAGSAVVIGKKRED